MTNPRRASFYILQFAHQIIPLTYHGSHCNRLEQFTACWNLLQNTCGPKVRGLEQHATLLVESCKIQSEMDAMGCHWQDMLLPHYISASRVTVWPTGTQALLNPMYLDEQWYSSLNGLMNDLDTVISLLQSGVADISKRCGAQSTERLILLLEKLRYLQFDAFKFSLYFYNLAVNQTLN